MYGSNHGHVFGVTTTGSHVLFCVTPTDSHVHPTLGRIVCMVFRSWLWVMVIVVRVRVRVRARARARDREWIFNCFFPFVLK